MNRRVLAIIVCHNPQPEALTVLLKALLNQGVSAVLVDNASLNQTELERVVNQAGDDFQLTRMEHNVGLGAAHNIGAKIARQGGYDYILLLDQDSVPLKGMVANLLDAHETKSKDHKVSAVGATYLNADNGAESFFVRFGWLKFSREFCAKRDSHGCIEADFLISSGSLIALDTLRFIGDMEEALFIDHVDTEWFLRARAKGHRAYGVCDAVMQHGLGEKTHQVNLGLGKRGRQRNVPQHKPFRYYYIFRNSILLYKRGYASALWKWNDIQRLLMIAIMFGLFKAPRAENAKMMWHGLMDGLRGKTGKVF